jgi:hypothetical protein
MRGTYFVFLLCSLSGPAAAMTGAQLLEAEREFAEGYVMGAVESHVFSFYGKPKLDAKIANRRACIISSKIDSGGLYELAARYVRRNPKTLPEPAFGAIINAISEMCD